MSERTTTSTTQLKEEEIFNYALNHAFEEGYSVALWRLPHQTSKNLLLSFSPQEISREVALEEMPPGFLIAPFNRGAERQLLKADVMLVFENSEPQHNTTSSQSIEWLNEASGEIKKNVGHRAKYHISKETPAKPLEQGDFCAMVEAGIKAIEAGVMEKVVPSRTKKIALPEGFDAVNTFIRLCEKYPGAMVSLVSIPEVGTWIGASPELLVEVINQSTFKTVALAGTRRKLDDVDPREVAWTQKEIEEQALVCRYIINCFKKIRLREYEEHGPKTVVAGNLMHLKTEYSVDMVATNFPQLGSVMLELLHPTSAVCGMPIEPATEFLNKFEKYNRSYYSGYLGPVNINHDTHIFVNLRCMHLLDQKATGYAGAGITIDSIPMKEWEETEMKLDTLLSVIL